jgi:hypothetical protein
MNLKNSIEERMVRYFVNPLIKLKPVDFKKTLKKASRILIILPSSTGYHVYPKTIKQVETVFQGSHLTLIHSGQPLHSEKQNLSHPVIYLHVKKQSLWQLKNSPVLSAVSREQFDVLLDMDPEFNLAGIYLAKRRPFLLCIGLSKPLVGRYYNLLYNGSPEATYEEKLSGLFRFLKSFTAK